MPTLPGIDNPEALDLKLKGIAHVEQVEAHRESGRRGDRMVLALRGYLIIPPDKTQSEADIFEAAAVQWTRLLVAMEDPEWHRERVNMEIAGMIVPLGGMRERTIWEAKFWLDLWRIDE